MRKMLMLAGLLLGSMTVVAGPPDPVPYPDGYRDWVHVKTMVIEEGHPLYASFGGMHHLYANRKALEGYRSGSFPDGAIIVFDLLAAVDADHAITGGARKVVGVMHRDRKRYEATGGWGFEGFKGDSRTERAVGASAKSACFDCHASRRDTDYVFSEYRP